MFLVSGLPVAFSIAPDEHGAFKLTHLIDGAEFLVFGLAFWICLFALGLYWLLVFIGLWSFGGSISF